MLENFKLAVRRQRKIIIIFMLTIFVPSLSLGIFGVRAIRGERFRLARQMETEHRRAADTLKSAIDSSLDELESRLRELGRSPLPDREVPEEIIRLLKPSLMDHPLCDQVFVALGEDEPWFPLLHASPPSSSSCPVDLSGDDRSLRRTAESREFESGDLKGAIELYRRLLDSSRDADFKARMLTGMARCQFKRRDYSAALRNYTTVREDFADGRSDSGRFLAIGAGLRMAGCLRKMGDHSGSLRCSLDLFRDIVRMRWPLKAPQFKTYASMAEESVRSLTSDASTGIAPSEYREEWSGLLVRFERRLVQWKTTEIIDRWIIPRFREKIDGAGSGDIPLHDYRITDGITCLVTAVRIPEGSSPHGRGLLGVNVDISRLSEEIGPDAWLETRLGDAADWIMSDMEGNLVAGEADAAHPPPTATAFFENNFPPWRIEVFPGRGGASGVLDARRRFFFWTIITLVGILVFGAFLISRSIMQETAVLKLKSDFVSSVSHEFKSPLTSIKSLSDRLRGGRVRDPRRMMEYFSVISEDTDRLMRMVDNILDFSRIEEDRKKYRFEEIDLVRLVEEKVEGLSTRESPGGVKIRFHAKGGIPLLPVDRDSLSRAVDNLLDNAVKFSPDRKEIDVLLDSDEARVLLEVRDKGIGIPSRELGRIFEKFYQVDSPSRISGRGAGLGLTLVKHAVEAHGGRISVSSRVGKGSVFTILLPIPAKER